MTVLAVALLRFVLGAPLPWLGRNEKRLYVT